MAPGAKKKGEERSPPNMHDRASAALRATGAASAALGALLLNLLLFHRYPLWTVESLIALMVLIGVASIYGLLYAAANRWIRAFLEALLVAIIIDGGGAPAPWPMVAGAVVLLFTLLTRRSILSFVTVAALVAALSSLAGLGQHREQAFTEVAKAPTRSRSPTGLPAIVHIILDEHGGIDGMPMDNPRTQQVREALQHFYIGNGFRLYTRAHSDYAYTLNSVPQVLNFGQVQEPGSSKEMKQKVEHTAYFDLLARRGHHINVYQSEFLDMCASASITHCVTYQSQDMGAVATSHLTTASKVSIILRKLTSRSVRKVGGFLYNGVRKLGVPLPFRDISDIRMNPLNAAAAFDRFNADLAKAKPGDVYFAHILLPHSPFGLTEDCRLKEGAWIRRERPGALRPRQDAGYDQLLCALRKTETAFRAISRSAAGDNFVMIVHGDHGSRTTNAKPFVDQAAIMTDAEKLANFSTLFAVRGPAITPGKDASPLSLSTLVTGLTQSRYTVAPTGRGTRPSQVFLDDEKHVPLMKINLPAGW